MPARNPVYAFDNSFASSPLAADPEGQAALLKRLGYGATYHALRLKTEAGRVTFLRWADIARDAGLEVAAYYTVFEPMRPRVEGERSLEEVIDRLPRGAVLELAISMEGARPSDAGRDAEVLARLKPLVARAGW